MLILKNLDVYHGKLYTLKKVSLHVKKGEIVVLIGSNGAGKTTLLLTISGLLRPYSGSILFDGKEIAGVEPERIVRMGISQVPEGRLIFKPMTVEENLILGSYHRYSFKGRLSIREDMERVYSIFPVLRQRRRQLAGTLSGGEQQMLALGRALMARPELLLLDEPSMGLAPTIIREIFRYIVDLKKEYNLTVLLVEQNARSALRIADRGYVIETGRIVLEGTSNELLSNRDVQRAYLGRDLDSEIMI